MHGTCLRVQILHYEFTMEGAALTSTLKFHARRRRASCSLRNPTIQKLRAHGVGDVLVDRFVAGRHATDAAHRKTSARRRRSA